MKTLIEGYEIFPGEHCGSASMRGLLKHYCGLLLPEPAVFGLGAGIDCSTIEGPAMDPQGVVFGRTGSLEADLGRILQVDYREQPEGDDAHAWQVVRDEVLAGRPTMLSGDILYLDYREYKVHFPGHRFVLLGFDDETEKAFIADRIRPVPEACSYGALRTSRNPPEGLSTHNLWGRFHDTRVGRTLPEAARSAIRECSARMLGRVDAGEFAPRRPTQAEGNEQPDAASGLRATRGVAGIRRLAEALPEWGKRDDATWIASFNARCIEKFGNGGGNFRRLYAGFLDWARELDPGLVPAGAAALATRAADGWTAISEQLLAASDDAAPIAPWHEAARLAAEVADLEQSLFEQLADQAG